MSKGYLKCLIVSYLCLCSIRLNLVIVSLDELINSRAEKHT